MYIPRAPVSRDDGVVVVWEVRVWDRLVCSLCICLFGRKGAWEVELRLAIVLYMRHLPRELGELGAL